MPREIYSVEEFRKILQKAEECRVSRSGDTVKIKLRTPQMLYTYRTNKDEADSLLKDVKVAITEF